MQPEGISHVVSSRPTGSRRRPGSIHRSFLPLPAWVPAFAGNPKARLSRALRRDAQVFVLVEHAVERVLVVLLDLEDADFPVGDVAVVVEADHTLQRLGFRGLDRVADSAAVDLFARFGDALDRIEDD